MTKSHCIALLLFGILACSRSDVESPRGLPGSDTRAFIAQVDSLTLEETDEFFLGEPAFIALDERGRIYVADSYSGSVLQFDRSGKAGSRFGRKGAGPGELLGPGALTVLGDSVLVVADTRGRKLVFFDLNDGAVLREVAHIGIVTSIDTIAGGLLLGRMDVIAKYSAARFRFSDSEVEAFGPVPSEYYDSPTLASVHPFSVAVSVDSGVVIGATGSGKLFLLNRNDRRVDSMVLPSSLRRGVPADIAALYNQPSSMEQKALLSSAMIRAGDLGHGWLGTVHMDYKVEKEAVTARAFLSMLHLAESIVCVDYEVPLAGHARPVVGVYGNAFMVLEQVIAAEQRATATVRFFSPDLDVCRASSIRVEVLQEG